MQNTDEIEKLYNRIVSLHQGIDTVRQPLLDIKSVIDEIKKLLDLPGTIAKDLKKLRTLISAVNEVMQLLEWIPGQFGTTCKTVHNLLSPLVAPPKKAILDKLIKSADDMSEVASQIKTYLEKIEPPINKALKEVNTVRDKVIYLEDNMAALVEHYKRVPPSEETMVCVRSINSYIDQYEKNIKVIEDQFDQAIRPLYKVLAEVKKYLDPVANIAQQITNVLKQIDIKPINDFICQVNKYKKKIADFRKKVVSKFEWAVKRAFSRFGIDIDAIDKQIQKLINSALKPLRNLIEQITNKINGLLSQIKSMLAKMLPVDQLQQIVTMLENMRDNFERELDKLAGSACKSVLKA